MGVPISFLSKYSPEQFEIIWQASGNTRASAPKNILEELKYTPHEKDKGGGAVIDGKMKFGIFGVSTATGRPTGWFAACP